MGFEPYWVCEIYQLTTFDKSSDLADSMRLVLDERSVRVGLME